MLSSGLSGTVHVHNGVPSEVVLYCTHLINPMIRGEMARLRAELPDIAHRALGYLKDNVEAPSEPVTDYTIYRKADLSALPYPRKTKTHDWTDTTGGNDLPALAFFRDNPHYDFYWLIEYDVRYTGSWRDLFTELRASDADLLATTIQDYEDNPGWWWWQTLVDIPSRRLDLLRAFLPFCRVSKRGMTAIDHWYCDGGDGHYEATWPSVCRTFGLKIEDVGGVGRYTPRERRGKHYSNSPKSTTLSPGTFVFRPPFKHTRVAADGLKRLGRPMLWHPVKD